jgi:hypothetical protein
MQISMTLARLSALRNSRWSRGFHSYPEIPSIQKKEAQAHRAQVQRLKGIKRLSKNIQGKMPYNYFLVHSSKRKEAILQHWIQYHEDTFEQPDAGYSLHTSLEALTKFYEKEGQIPGGLRKILSYQNPGLAGPKTIYLTKKTYELMSRKSKNTAGVAVTTYSS